MSETQSAEQAAALQKQNCIFCKIIKDEIPSKKVHEDKICVAILDINPANEGHVILLPKEHYQIMPQVPKEVIMHLGIVSKKISKALLISTLGKSTSIFVANGAVAGQKAPHFMVHIIPRKSEKEFFDIQSTTINADDLDKVKNIIIKKIENITGKKIHSSPQQIIQEAPLPVHQVNYQRKEEIIPMEVAEEKIQEIKPLFTHPRKISRVGIKKEKGYLYYIDADGDVARVPMARGGKKQRKSEKVKINEKENTESQNNEVDNNKNSDEDISEDNNSNTNLDNTSSDKSDESTSRSNLDDISRLLLGGRI